MLATPCDLWVLPTPRYSRWFTRLDWYLNWQMCKGLAYGGLHLPAETYQTAEENGVPILPCLENINTSPLLVSSQGLIPANGCLVLEGADDPKKWLARIAQLAVQLSAKKLHVFLPTGVTISQAEKWWAGKPSENKHHIQFSADLGANP